MFKLHHKGVENNKNVNFFLNELVVKINHIHQTNKITLLDVDARNIMNCEGTLKLIDLGFARILNDEKNHAVYPHKFDFGSHCSPVASYIDMASYIDIPKGANNLPYTGRFKAGNLLVFFKNIYPPPT